MATWQEEDAKLEAEANKQKYNPLDKIKSDESLKIEEIKNSNLDKKYETQKEIELPQM